LFEDILKNFL